MARAALNAVPVLLFAVLVTVAAVTSLRDRHRDTRAQQRTPVPVYRVPDWAARTPDTLRQHPDLAQLDQQLDQLAAYYPAPERSDT